MRLIIFVLPALVFISCQTKSVLSKQLDGADSLVINFNISRTDTIARTLNTTEAKAIKKIIQFADQDKTTYLQCGYDGNLVFYERGVIKGDLAINFTAKGCEHFMMRNGEELIATEMNAEAIDFFTSLSQGKAWY